jgi:spermidine synthase
VLHLEKRRTEAFGLGLGAWATAAQVVLLREALSVSSGDELVLGLAFASWLLGVAAGAAAASRARSGATALAAAQIALGPLALAALAALRLQREILGTAPGAEPGTVAAAALLAAALAPVAAAVGFAFTAAARTGRAGERPLAARIYVAEAAGALAAGLLFSLVLAARSDHVTILTLFCGGALACFGAAATRSRYRAALLALAALCAVSALSGATGRLDAALTARSFAGDPTRGRLVAAADSAYGRLALGERDGQYTLFEDGRPAEAFPDPWERPVQIHLALTEHPRPRSALLLGGGVPDRLSAALAHGLDRIVLTYLDAREHALCAPFWPAEARRAIADPRVSLVRDDGRRFVAATRERFDVVVIASPPPRTGRANRYHTAELFAAVRRILKPGGLVALRVPGGANVLSDEAARAAASTWRAVRASFAATVLSPGTEVAILAAVRPEDLTADPAVLEARFRARVKEAGGFVPERFADLLDAQRARALRRRLDATAAPMNTDARPYAYLAGVELRERQGASALGREALTATGLASRFAWLFLALPLGAWIAWRALPSRRRGAFAGDALWSIATTGAAGMAVEMLILYAFQTAAGVLYAALAGIVAAFMAGLGLGAIAGMRALRGPGHRGAVAADAAVLVLLLATGPVLGAALERAWIAVAWSALAGSVTGAAFPAFLAAAARSLGADERASAGPIEAADHFGAAFGALVTGLVWLPLYGLASTALLFAALKATALAGSVAAARVSRAA